MFIIDFHTLQTIHFLDLIDEIVPNRCWSENMENIVRRDSAFTKVCSGINIIAFMNNHVFTIRDRVYSLFPINTHHMDLADSALCITKTDGTIDFCHDSRVCRFPRFKQFSNTGKTPRNITSFTNILWNFHQSLSTIHYLFIRYNQGGFHG